MCPFRKVTRIRAGRPDEAQAFADLHLSTALHAYAHIFPPDAPVPTLSDLERRWSAVLHADRQTVLAVDVDGAVAGVVCGGPDELDETAGHLTRLYVRPEHWGRGIGRALHDACVRQLRESDFEVATLWVLDRNERARRWYEGLGWKITGGYKTVYEPAGIFDLRYRLLLVATPGAPALPPG